MADKRIIVAAVCFQDDSGRVLTVRKRGTARFILPGGKLRPTEGLASAAVREVREELGLELALVDLAWLGTWTALAANEPDHHVIATVFSALLPGTPRASAEIDEVQWVDPAGHEGLPVAPLLRDFVLPSVA
ncbi:NUDIX domain-containing protein [Rarobacter faecitabidus]|uniref:ADP-ribose pyrophosphatase YjhB (NUDIX family) n=1 Tax=Rarobacter faecitabidus TaxID=13243 RepID=A0A542ZAZ8_RARFA|nr:NUDIX domain-containing protein [Rarobacter faecitabidus]TQL57523.1 ADP-ribose pyrophosphatase YjhB (NUDIX family) [Rarobacter faecitabidus]